MIYYPCNIYPGAKIGKNINVGMFTEIHNVVIGDNVKIGASCFIPEGVTIEDNVFIGAHVKFSNDKYPPSSKDEWEVTLVRQGASIGTGVCILPGITIGKNSIIGMGSVVTKDVPDGATVCGVPARILEKKEVS